jgi:hypothetical protein
LKNPQISKFHENNPVGAKFFLEDRQVDRQTAMQAGRHGQTDKTKLIVSFTIL